MTIIASPMQAKQFAPWIIFLPKEQWKILHKSTQQDHIIVTSLYFQEFVGGPLITLPSRGGIAEVGDCALTARDNAGADIAAGGEDISILAFPKCAKRRPLTANS
jgi:hypothetical protein